ncbi:MAG: hypothetical protein H7Z72_17220, partial [Bacteroidetes bacterium]|nr:hypothetical protein [Fibrella sp.]
MPVTMPADTSFMHLFDTLTDGVIGLEAVYENDTSSVIDFRVSYCNPSARMLLTNVYNLVPETWLLRDNPGLTGLFGSCLSVIETGLPADSDLSAHPTRRLVVRQLKSANGLVLIVQVAHPTDEVAGKPAPEMPPLKGILNSSLNGIVAYRA